MKAFSITALAILAAGAVAAGREEDAAEGRRLRGGIVISEATTRITGPLDVHGAVGYVAALNEHYGQGVTRENNAALAFWQAVGPRPVPPDDRQDYNAVLEAGNAFFDRQVEALSLPTHRERMEALAALAGRGRAGRLAYPEAAATASAVASATTAAAISATTSSTAPRTSAWARSANPGPTPRRPTISSSASGGDGRRQQRRRLRHY